MFFGNNLLTFLLCSLYLLDGVICAGTKYKPEWSSLDSRPLPKWFDEAKVGIFLHWGVYSVPSLTSEWFWMDWKGVPLHDRHLHLEIESYMKRNFRPGFTYQDFAKDFTAEFFNATEWVGIIEKSGARYVVLTSKHHDGFCMWPSKYSYGWNSIDTGPHMDVVGELARAVKTSKHGIKFGLYHSLYEWFNPLYLSDKSNNFTTLHFVNEKIFPEMLELVNTYKPEIFWSDGEAEAESSYWRSEEYLAWLYNESPVSKSIVVNDRWGRGTICKHGGYLTCSDRYTPGQLQPRKWENAMSLDRKSWGYSRRSNIANYLSSQELIDILVKTVALGGNLLVNVGPNKEGRISPVFEERLLDMGQWLGINGKAIYGTTPWPICQNDTSSIWYTRNIKKDLFAIVLKWPKTNILHLKCPQLSKQSKIYFTGVTEIKLDWSMESDLLKITLPKRNTITGQWAWVLKLTNLLN